MKGKIVKLNKWHKGAGSFIKIDETEYIILAGTDAKVGDVVEYELANKFMFNKQVLSKLLLPLEAYVQPARDEDRAKPAPVAVVPFRAHDVPKLDARETYWANREKHDIEKDATITRLSCISSAVNLHAQDSATPIETVIADAKKLEAYASGKQ